MRTRDKSKRQNQDPFYYRYREQFVGIFVLIPLIVIPIVLAKLFIQNDWFNQRFSLHLRLDHGARIESANSVTIMEKRVGYVKEVTLNPEGYLDVEMRIEEKYRNLIKKDDSRGTVKQKEIMVGDWSVDISIGSKGGLSVEDGDTILTGEFIRVEEMIERLTKMSIRAEKILNAMVDGGGTISKLLVDDTLSEQFMVLLDESITLFKDIDKTLLDASPLLSASEKAIQSLENLGKEGVSMTKELDRFARSANNLVDSLHPVVKRIDTVFIETGNVPPVMNSTFEDFEKSLEELNLILNGVKNHWFLRRSIRKANEKESEK